MPLASIWNGQYCPLPALPLHCRAPLGVFGFPILFLMDSSATARQPRVFSDDFMLALDLTLGEVLAEEMNIVVPDGSMIVVCTPIDQSDAHLGLRLAGEVLYKIIATYHGKEPSSLFYWTFQSLALTWLGEEHTEHAALDLIALDILGLPRVCSCVAAQEYLSFLEPDFRMKKPWIGLGNLLAERQTAKAGYRALQKSFAAADVLVNIGL